MKRLITMIVVVSAAIASYVWAQSASQATQGTAVSFWSEPIRPGDLVFMATKGNDVITHVGIAIDNDTWIQARRPGDVVRVGPMPSKSSIVAVRRFIP